MRAFNNLPLLSGGVRRCRYLNIWSLYTQVLGNVLLHGSDQEKDSVIAHVAFTNNAHMDFVEKLEGLTTKETVHTDSLLLAYGALHGSKYL